MTTTVRDSGSEPDRHVFSFDGFFLDARQRVLLKADGERIVIGPRALDTLICLVERAGELLERRVLMKAVWPNTVVEENNLSQHIVVLRRALGESGRAHRFIVTVPGRGFRFVAPVRRLNALPVFARGSVSDCSRPLASPTLAVLPFADMSPAGDQEYFADGLAEELAACLGRLPGLRVIGRTSAFSYKGRNENLRTIAHALGADYILEGSVRKAGDQLRITARLVDSDGARVWSGTYDQTLGNVLAIQDQVARSIAALLSVELTPAHVARPLMESPAPA